MDKTLAGRNDEKISIIIANGINADIPDIIISMTIHQHM